MRFGCCVGPENIGVVADAGFDFCELPARAVMPLEDEAAALPALRALAAAPIPAEAFNVLVPAQLPLVGPGMDREALRAYLRRAFERMVQLGGAAVVLGSGAARRIPDDMPRPQALDQLADSFALAADEAAKAGIDLALEHLNRGECNVFTSLAECQQFIEERGLGLKLLADLHHLELEHEPLDVVVAAAPHLAHIHVADGGRKAPGHGGYDYAGFMQRLRTVGYDRRISAECSWDDLASEAPAALAYMRDQWHATGGAV
jgi:D-psicose/D-tagatose/L-ribulose 3-epimerase